MTQKPWDKQSRGEWGRGKGYVERGSATRITRHTASLRRQVTATFCRKPVSGNLIAFASWAPPLPLDFYSLFSSPERCWAPLSVSCNLKQPNQHKHKWDCHRKSNSSHVQGPLCMNCFLAVLPCAGGLTSLSSTALMYQLGLMPLSEGFMRIK